MLTRDINTIVSRLESNNIVSIPTDTVYGFSCLINPTSVNKLIELKQRKLSKGFIIISSSPEHLLKYIDTKILSQNQITKIQTIPSTPTTWIVPTKNNTSWLTGGRNSIAIRLVNTEIVSKICNSIDDAIISTSANISNSPSIKDYQSISLAFPNIVTLENKHSHSNTPSIIIDILNNKQIR